MNRIITISREFGSGGREIGKRLAEKLGVAYYDNEVISEIVRHSQLAEDYVRSIVEGKRIFYFPIKTGISFSPIPDCQLEMENKVYMAQEQAIKELAEKSDCIIIGRCADYILSEMHPLRIYIYADMEFKIDRCIEKGEEIGLSRTKIQHKIKQIDIKRANYYETYTGQKWGDRRCHDLCINTTSIPVKEAALLLANMLDSKVSK